MVRGGDTFELEDVRRRYAEMQRQKSAAKEMAVKKAMRAAPSQTQRRLYERGVYAIQTKKKKEFQLENPAFAKSPSFDGSKIKPSKIHNRLYEQGLRKMTAQREKEAKKKEQRERSSSRRRTSSSSPAIDRLYQRGVAKVQAARSREQYSVYNGAARRTSTMPARAVSAPRPLRSESPAPMRKNQTLSHHSVGGFRAASTSRRESMAGFRASSTSRRESMNNSSRTSIPSWMPNREGTQLHHGQIQKNYVATESPKSLVPPSYVVERRGDDDDLSLSDESDDSREPSEK